VVDREDRGSPAALIAAVITALLLAGAVWPASGAPAFPVTVRDAAGRDILIPTLPRRIVSLAPSVTEILFALDLEGELVGVSDADDYPPGRITLKPRVGGVVINIERVVALRPDLVIGMLSLQRDQLARLEAARLRVLAVDAASADDTLAQIRLLGRATGRVRQSEAVASRLVHDLAAARPTVRRSVYIEVWSEPPIAAAAGTLVDDLVARAGGVNVFADLRGYPQVSAEAVVARDPQVIFLLYPQSAGFSQRPAWQTIDAVRARRVQSLPASLVSRPGPRIGQGLALISRTLQGSR
jgi:iron complex transport system substrate-binding protein